MSVTISVDSNGFYSPANYTTGQPIQMAYGESQNNGSKVFTAWNTFEEVPGGLRATITPKFANSKMIIQAKIFWGGVSGTTDVAANFRILKSIDGGSTWTKGNMEYSTDAGLGIQSEIGVATGTYMYNMGDGNSSSIQDNILMVDTSADSTASTIYAVHWACGYAPNSRTLYWNRTIAGGNSYNSPHINTITVTEIKQ